MDIRRNAVRWLEILRQDLRFAVRTLRKAPAVTAAAVLTIALGVGLNAATLTETAFLLATVAALASYLPARAAARIDKLKALQAE